MTPIPITNPQDPRIAAYRDIRERDLVGRQGRFVAEGEVVLRHLLGPRSRFECESVLVAENRYAGLADLLAEATAPVFVADQAVMDAIAGFAIHRGILGIGLKGEGESPSAVLGRPDSADLALGIVGIGNHDNMGGLFRAAAGFGARGVLLDDTCCDPLYRKAIRVSVGAALITPFARAGDGAAVVGALEAAGYAPLALTPGGTEPLAAVRRDGPVALIVGAEGPGLPEAVMRRCRRVAIPMAEGFDSLNVATAAAIALHHLRACQT
jgi:tRNA G18 (ribose-2'-O)-methylase SpoU